MKSQDILLGLGGCVDIELNWDALTLSRLAQDWGITAAEVNADTVIDSERSLVVTLLGLMQGGRGGERPVSSPDVVSAFAGRFGRRRSLGGTGVRAARALALLGRPCTVHVASMNDLIAQLLPRQVAVVAGTFNTRIYPHLIVQYPAGGCVDLGTSKVVAQQANRLILTHDPDSVRLPLNPDLAEHVSKAQVILLSGFNAISDLDLLTRRLGELRQALSRRRTGTVVMYEDAGFHRRELRAVVIDQLAAAWDVHSLNEDELRSYLGRDIDLLDAAQVAAAVPEAAGHLGCRTLVLHTHLWALAFGKEARRYRQALAQAVATASARFWKGDQHTQAEVAAAAMMPTSQAVRQFLADMSVDGDDKWEFVPVPDIGSAATTVGLGDSFVGGFLSALS